MTEKVSKTPAGQRIRNELKKRGWTQADLFRILGRTRRVVSETITGARPMTPRMAADLEEVFGVSRRVWWALNARFVLNRLTPDPAIARLAKLFRLVPVSEMLRQNRLGVGIKENDHLQYCQHVAELEAAICAFLGVASPDAEAKGPAPTAHMRPAERGWFLRARALASRMDIPEFRADEMDGYLDRLRMRCAVVYPRVRGVLELLRQAGIRLVIVEELARAQINGAVFGLDATKPVIALTLRDDHLERFWYWLVHELRHVKQGHALLAHPTLDVHRGSGGTVPPDEEDTIKYATDFLDPDGLDKIREQRSNALRASPADPERLELLRHIRPSTSDGRASRSWRRELLRSARTELALEPHLILDGWGRPAALP
jgi:HTH-type transcriptional regulator / antitoxin HigA